MPHRDPPILTPEENAEMAGAQRIAYHAALLADRLLPDHADAADLEARVIRLLELALGLAKGLDPTLPAAARTSPGAPPTDWEGVTGKTLDRLIYEVRLQAVVDRHVYALELEGIRIPWKAICETVLKPASSVLSKDAFRTYVVRLAEHLKPGKLKARYGRIDGWTAWNIDDFPAAAPTKPAE